MFARPSREIPGRWQLVEYYSESSGNLINRKEPQLKDEKTICEVNFGENGDFYQNSNLQEGVFSRSKFSRWKHARNYVILAYSDQPDEKNEVFQFAIENGILKLLKKNVNGQIDFFGFFRRAKN